MDKLLNPQHYGCEDFSILHQVHHEHHERTFSDKLLGWPHKWSGSRTQALYGSAGCLREIDYLHALRTLLTTVCSLNEHTKAELRSMPAQIAVESGGTRRQKENVRHTPQPN